MKFAYADPPYIGQAKRHYKSIEVDHNQLLIQLCADFDAWALSCSSTSLKTLLSLSSMPDDVRIGAWVKPYCSYKPNVKPAYAWEPVIFKGSRILGNEYPTTKDWVASNSTRLKGLHGAKPEEFCYWLFYILGALPGDTFVDLFPGTGIVTKCWDIYRHL